MKVCHCNLHITNYFNKINKCDLKFISPSNIKVRIHIRISIMLKAKQHMLSPILVIASQKIN